MENENDTEDAVEIFEESMTPGEISDLISEDLIPGRLGLSEEEDTGQVISELAGQQQQKGGNGEEPLDVKTALETILNISQHIVRFNEDLAAKTREGDVREIRLRLIELLGGTQQAMEQVNLLCDLYGLPRVAV